MLYWIRHCGYNGVIDPKIGLPQGIDKGWDYQPGASVADDLARLKQMEQDKLKRLGNVVDNPLIDSAPPRSTLKITTLPNIEIFSKLSDRFLKEIDQAVSTIHESTLKLLEQHGDSLKLSPQLKELLPELSGKPMIGDLSGRTFDQSPGLYDRRKKVFLFLSMWPIPILLF